ncbi:MAG TPA: hypothetical protein DIT48_09940, partial [Actinobacteria bacterium]|nr:hypothetical protein [Actinomycetota bacterium]
MAQPDLIPAEHHTEEPDWLEHLDPAELVYFLLNVGDGDAQVLVLPEVQEPGHPLQGRRQAIVVDAALRGKVPSLITALAGASLLPTDPAATAGAVELAPGSIALVAVSYT